MRNNRDLSVPKKERLDYELTILKGLLSAKFGGWTGPVVDFVLKPPLAKKMQKWQESVAAGLCEAIQQGRLDKDKIEEHDVLMASIISATLNAAATAEEEKLDALRNALVNIAIAPDEDSPERKVFLSYVMTFDVWHIRYLKFFQSPDEIARKSGWKLKQQTDQVAIDEFIRCIYPNCGMTRDPSVSIVNELVNRQLVSLPDSRVLKIHAEDQFNRRPAPDGWTLHKHTTAFGDKFLAFITLPFDEPDLSGMHEI